MPYIFDDINYKLHRGPGLATGVYEDLKLQLHSSILTFWTDHRLLLVYTDAESGHNDNSHSCMYKQ